MQYSVFNLLFQIGSYTRVITATIMFPHFNFVVILRWYSKNPRDPKEIPGAALELQQLKIEQFSPVILKFGIKHVVNPLTLNC